MQDKIGVVTVTYQGAKVIDDFMKSLLAQSYTNFNLFVVDNQSKDDTLSRIANYRDSRIHVTSNSENLGVAAGNNQGIKAALDAGCAQVLLINNDTVFQSELLETLHTQMHALDCKILVPKILYFEPPEMIWCAGGYFSQWRAYASLHFGQRELDRGQYDMPRRIDYAPTCCMLIDSTVFSTVGMMDEAYFVYYDDADFCFRCQKLGVKMMYTSAAKLWHKESSATGGSASAFTIKYAARNKVYFLRRNLRTTWWWWALLYQLYLVGRLISRRDSFYVFRLKQRSYVAGLTL